MTGPRRLIAALLALLAAAALVAPAQAAAQTAPATERPAPRTTYYAVESRVMCVTCNVALGVAESDQAKAQKEEIRLLVAQGLTLQQILDRLVGEYGNNVLASPPAEGISLLAYVVPVAVVVALLLLGLLLLPRWLRRQRASSSAAWVVDPHASELSNADARRLDDDMSRFAR